MVLEKCYFDLPNVCASTKGTVYIELLYIITFNKMNKTTIVTISSLAHWEVSFINAHYK